MKVYFVRHGESESNKLRLHQFPEERLSVEGIKQAQLLAKRFKNIPIDAILSSDYDRAKNTADEIAKISRKKVEVNILLRERRFPVSFRGKPVDSAHIIEIKSLIIKNRFDPTWHHSDEENFYDVQERIKKFFSLLEKRAEKHIVIVTHAAFIKATLTYLMFGAQSNPDLFHSVFSFFWTHNVGISVFEFRKSEVIPKITENKKWHLLTWNDHAHLG